MKIKLTSIKTQLTILDNGSRSCEGTEAVSGRKPVLARLVRLLWAAALALPAFGAQAAVVFTNLHSFSGNDGANPQAGLVQGSDGNFYGTTYSGGNTNLNSGSGYGTVFKISTNGVLTTLYSFSGGIDGANPRAGLVQGSDGNFYGTTRYGGTHDAGTVFEIRTNGALTSLYSFGSVYDDGGWPQPGLVQGRDGYFYGTTSIGGTNNLGTVFRISANGALTSLYSFTGGTDGAYPTAALVQGSDGYFYGTTGDVYGSSVFEISANGALTPLYLFPQSSYGGVGVSPNGLVQGTDGNFYGTTFADGYWRGGPDWGGYFGGGTVFEISTYGALTTLYSFTGGSDGANPQAGLVQGSDGGFYGTTSSGGAGGAGTVFRLTIVPVAPVFQPVRLTNGMVSLTWSTEAQGRYQLQYKSDLSSSNWTNLGSALTATGATLSGTDSMTNGPRRFYRVVLSP